MPDTNQTLRITLPSLAKPDATDCGLPNSEHLAHLCLSPTRPAQRTDAIHLALSELGRGSGFAMRHPTLAVRVINVLLLSAKKQVQGINALSRVAGMAHEQGVGLFSVVEKVCDAVCQIYARLNVEKAVTRPVTAGFPQVTPSLVRGRNVGSKPSEHFFGQCWNDTIVTSHEAFSLAENKLWSDPLRKLELLRGSFCIIA